MASHTNPVHGASSVSTIHPKRDDKMEPDGNDVNLQVINLGLSRTGTASICEALEILGFGPSHQGIDLFRIPSRNEAFHQLYKDLNSPNAPAPNSPALNTRLLNLMRGYRSSCDHPLASIAPWVYPAWPNAKYILGTRPPSTEGLAPRDAWWKSFQVVGIHFRGDFRYRLLRFCIYPVGFLRKTDNRVQEQGKLWTQLFGPKEVWYGPQLYGLHNALVKSIVPPEQLLVYDVSMGWEPLCDFLGVPLPDRPFPLLNEDGNMKAMYLGMQLYGICVWCFYAGIVLGTGYAVMYPEVVKELWAKGLDSAAKVLAYIRLR